MSFSLKLEVSASDVPCAYSITNLVVEKVRALQDSFKTICGIEVHLFEGDDFANSSKGATLSINTTHQKTLVESCNSKNWEDAVMCAYEKVEQRFTSLYY